VLPARVHDRHARARLPLRHVAQAILTGEASAIAVRDGDGMLPMAASFLATLAVLVGVLAATSHGFFAVWHFGPVTGLFYWVTIVLSPETLIFVFFMMSDPSDT
jgi:hypothetical protein